MGTITIETKSGANQVHGSGFDFIRNNALDARGFFAAAPPVLNPKLRSPWTFNENLSLAKNFPVTERVKLRFEGFNVLNRMRWGAPNATLSSTTFGKVTSQGNNPRRLQVSFKVMF